MPPIRAKKRNRGTGGSAVRYAAVGLGHIAQAAMLPAFAHTRGNSRLVALVSGSPKKLKILGRRYRVTRLCSYADAEELFRSGELDAVYIALPNHLHEEWAVRAARAGLHVLCEKPMAVTVRQCQNMIREASKARVKLMIAYRLHFEHANLEAAKLARQGKLGDLRFFSSDFSLQVRVPNIRLEREKGGGPLYDIGIYCINAIRSAFGDEAESVFATATRSRDRRFHEVDETVSAAMRFKDEKLATFTCSFGAADRSIYTITGTRGSVTLDPAYEYAQGLALSAKIGERNVKRRFGKHDQFAAELSYFSNCILNDRVPEPAGEEGLADVRVIEALSRSIRTGRWVGVQQIRKRRHPTLRQESSLPPVPREPPLVDVKPSSE